MFALVTGACGLLGSSLVQTLLAEGSKVLAVDINQVSLDHLSSTTSSSNLITLSADITSEHGIQGMFEFVSTLDSPITAIAHCAYPRSVGWGTPFEDLSSRHLFEDLNLQLGGTILLCKSAVKYFYSNGGGSMVLLSSIQGVSAPKFDHYAGTNMTSPIEYSAIKSGIISITRWLAKYCANKNIRVNCVSPGGILADQPQVFLENYRKSCTNHGMLQPSQVASFIYFLLSDSSSAMNGQNVIVDDGWTL